MSLIKVRFLVSDEHKAKRLDHVLATLLPLKLARPVSKAKVRKLIVAGAVYLDGKRVRIASKELKSGAKVEVYVDIEKLFSSGADRDVFFEFKPNLVLFEDDYLIAVNKPAGLPTQPTLDEARDNLFALLKKYLGERDNEINRYLGLHHRLDKETSGVILFTKAEEANAGVADLFSKHLAEKTYNAITIKPQTFSRACGEGWEIKNFLGPLKELTSKKRKYGAVKSGGSFAHTSFKLLETFSSGLWLEAKPKTGRTHQIRAHLSESGMPIIGDVFYGAPKSDSRLMLHALSLKFVHPVTKKEIIVKADLPEDFRTCLDNLRNRASN